MVDMMAVNGYMSADRPTRYILDGEGFRSSADNPERKIISIEECKRKPDDRFQFNPYGYLRLNPEE